MQSSLSLLETTTDGLTAPGKFSKLYRQVRDLTMVGHVSGHGVIQLDDFGFWKGARKAVEIIEPVRG